MKPPTGRGLPAPATEKTRQGQQFFIVDLAAEVTDLTYTVPTGVHRLVTGLKPASGYDVASQASGGSVQITINPGTVLQADAGGVLDVPPP